MSDLLEVVVVTIVAGFALLVLLRPYVRKRRADTPPCPNCGAAAAARRRQRDAVQPVTFITPFKPR
ncbi:MAG: hypothetical protein IT184_04580 [Acidobacteria bacterium]|nr:hypothetical protein [Acidobacteriota bacterium]